MSPRGLTACRTSMVGPLEHNSQVLPVTSIAFALHQVNDHRHRFHQFHHVAAESQRERERQVGIIAIGTWDSLGHCRHMSHIDTPLFVFRCAALLETEGGDACAGKSGFWVYWEVRVAVSVSQYVRILHMFLPSLELKGAKYGSCFSGLWQQAAGKTSGKAAVLPQHTTGTTTVPLKLLRRSNQIASVDTRARLPCRVITYSEKSGKHMKTYSTLIDLDCHFPCFLGCYGSCMIVEQIWWYPRTLYAVEPCVLISILYEKESLLTSPGPYTLPYTKAFAWAAHAQCKWPCPVAEVRDNRCINRIYGLRWRLQALQEVDPCNPMLKQPYENVQQTGVPFGSET